MGKNKQTNEQINYHGAPFCVGIYSNMLYIICRFIDHIVQRKGHYYSNKYIKYTYSIYQQRTDITRKQALVSFFFFFFLQNRQLRSFHLSRDVFSPRFSSTVVMEDIAVRLAFEDFKVQVIVM